MKTLQECKDEVAITAQYGNWESAYKFLLSITYNPFRLSQLFDEAAEMYADQYRSLIDELKENLAIARGIDLQALITEQQQEIERLKETDKRINSIHDMYANDHTELEKRIAELEEQLKEAQQKQREVCCKALADSPTASNHDKIKVLTAGIPPKYSEALESSPKEQCNHDALVSATDEYNYCPMCKKGIPVEQPKSETK